MRARESNTAHRRRSKAKRDMRVKMGHGGTLDPLAAGVLILGIGRGTKELKSFIECTKTYETVVLFGASTDTYDRVGRVLKRRPYDEITRAKVEEALEGFRGTFQQMPPLYSALKMNGKPLYEYAREGLSIPREIETRQVTVSELSLVEWYEPGQHNHRWPAEEAGMAEQSLAERVWRMEKEQASGRKRTAEEEKDDIEALAAHEDFKRRAEEKQDELVFDKPAKRRRGPNGTMVVDDGFRNRRNGSDDQLMMSGALGELPSSPYHDQNGSGSGAAAKDSASASTKNSGRQYKMQVPGGRGSNLIPPPAAPNTPPPWEGKGPAAAKIRLTVSSGFYVRSFCHDLGEKLGSAAMMSELARTRQSDFRLGSNTVLEYDDISKGEAVWVPKIERLLRMWRDGTIGQSSGASASSDQDESGANKETDTAATAGSEAEETPVATTNGKSSASPPAADRTRAVLPTPEDENAEAVDEEWNGIADDEASAKTNSKL